MKTGTVDEAPPTAMPRMKRVATSTATEGASTEPSTPIMNTSDRPISVLRRPNLSDSVPARSEPSAAPNTRDEVTMPSVTGVRPRPP